MKRFSEKKKIQNLDTTCWLMNMITIHEKQWLIYLDGIHYKSSFRWYFILHLLKISLQNIWALTLPGLGKLSKDILPNNGISNYEHSFSLNPISEQLAFFDTTSSSKYGNSRPNSPLSQYNELVQPNFSKMSPNFTALHHKENGLDRSFNSSLDGLTQEAFLELRPKAESSPVTNDKNSHNLKKKSWMEKKLTINVSVYSMILFSSIAANIALIIYFLLWF